jgi:hypothetical protein
VAKFDIFHFLNFLWFFIYPVDRTKDLYVPHDRSIGSCGGTCLT